MAADLDPTAWPVPAVFSWLMAEGGIAAPEMVRTFNCGIGMIAVVAADHADNATHILAADGEQVFRIGEIVARGDTDDAVRLPGLEAAWRA